MVAEGWGMGEYDTDLGGWVGMVAEGWVMGEYDTDTNAMLPGSLSA